MDNKYNIQREKAKITILDQNIDIDVMFIPVN